MTYMDFLRSKIVTAPETGFTVSDSDINPALKPHQRDAVKWAVAGGRRGYMCELNPDYFRDAVGYLKAEEEKQEAPTLFDLLGEG